MHFGFGEKGAEFSKRYKFIIRMRTRAAVNVHYDELDGNRCTGMGATATVLNMYPTRACVLGR